jgi:hypothetical protein
MHQNSCGCIQAAMKFIENNNIRKTALGDVQESSAIWMVVPTITAIIIIA